MICVEAEAAEEAAAADGRRGEDLKTRTPHNDVGKNRKPIGYRRAWLS